MVVRSAAELAAAAALVARVAEAEPMLDPDGRRVSAPVREPVASLTALLAALEAAGIAAEDVALRRPTLDEVFLQLTGRAAEPEEVAA